MAGHWHSVPRRVLAKQRWAARSRNVGFMRLFGGFSICPTLIDGFRDNSLSARIDVHHLHCLLALATELRQRLGLRGEGAEHLGGEVAENLCLGDHIAFADHREAAHRGLIGRHHLREKHRFHLVLRLHAVDHRECTVDIGAGDLPLMRREERQQVGHRSVDETLRSGTERISELGRNDFGDITRCRRRAIFAGGGPLDGDLRPDGTVAKSI